MKRSLKWAGMLGALALVAAPLSPASAADWHHGGWGGGWHRGRGGPGFGLVAGLVGVGAALGYAVTTVATAPFYAVGNAVAPPPPVYAAPAPVYAYPAGYYGYYHHPHYAYAQPVYAYPY